MVLPSSVFVIGTGLLGTSVGLAARRAGVGHVVGYDRDHSVAEAARDFGGFHEAAASLDGVAEADVVVVATPVGAAAEVLRQVAPRVSSDAIVTDTLSTKSSVLHAAVDVGLAGRFVAAHPMAGSHQGGPSAARVDLFDDATCYVINDTTGRGGDFWRQLGCRVDATLTAEAHDDLMATVSHLPHLAAVALRLTAGTRATRGGPGFRDTTRVAGGSADLWADILLDNRGSIAQAAEAMQAELGRLVEAIGAGDRAMLVKLLGEAKAHAGA